MLDEHLELLGALWTGRPVRHRGTHYRAEGPEWAAVCHPPPVHGRVPVWAAGTWPVSTERPRPFARAAGLQGVVPMRVDGRWEVADTAGVRALVTRLREEAETGGGPFEIAVPGETPAGGAGAQVRADHAGAGATWWVEAVHPWRYGWTEGDAWPLAAMHERILAGP